MTYAPRHRGEPEERIFKPGDIVALLTPAGTVNRNRNGERLRFLVCVGGYMTVGDWAFHASDSPMTSRLFALVGQATPQGRM